jgi:hypothetical protein
LVRVDVHMRLASAFVFLLALSACDDAGQPVADGDGGDRPQISAEQVEAERVCAELTGYAPGGVEADAGTTAKREKEYKDCVAAVTGGGPPELRGRSGATPSDS